MTSHKLLFSSLFFACGTVFFGWLVIAYLLDRKIKFDLARHNGATLGHEDTLIAFLASLLLAPAALAFALQYAKHLHTAGKASLYFHIFFIRATIDVLLAFAIVYALAIYFEPECVEFFNYTTAWFNRILGPSPLNYL